MKYTHFVKLGLLVALVVMAGCAKPADPTQADKPSTETVATSTPAASTVAQLGQEWTVINFGAPW